MLPYIHRLKLSTHILNVLTPFNKWLTPSLTEVLQCYRETPSSSCCEVSSHCGTSWHLKKQAVKMPPHNLHHHDSDLLKVHSLSPSSWLPPTTILMRLMERASGLLYIKLPQCIYMILTYCCQMGNVELVKHNFNMFVFGGFWEEIKYTN